jgi:hypothetical protein
MFQVINHRDYCALLEFEKYIVLESVCGDILVIYRNIFRRAISRQNPECTKNPEMLQVDGESLILTGNEWKKVVKKTMKNEFFELYQSEKRGRLEILKKFQKVKNVRLINEANIEIPK